MGHISFCSVLNLLGQNILANAIKNSTGTLVVTNKEVGLEVDIEKTMYKFTSCHQTTGQNHYIKPLKMWQGSYTYFGVTVTNQNHILVEIKGRLHSENASYCVFYTTLY
jgi:hypothetical protein